jgi:hypothetical protein
MIAYWKRYCPKALADPSKLSNMEILARVHNGGPHGDTNPATLSYWNKVKAYLRQ